MIITLISGHCITPPPVLTMSNTHLLLLVLALLTPGSLANTQVTQLYDEVKVEPLCLDSGGEVTRTDIYHCGNIRRRGPDPLPDGGRSLLHNL